MDGTDPDAVIRIRTNALLTESPRTPVASIWHGLRRARIDAGLDVEELAARARLSVVTVEAIEAGAVDRLPIGEAGRREVVRHCQALGADPEPFLEALRERRTPALGRRFERQRPANRRSRLAVYGLVWAILALGFVGTWLLTGSSDEETAPEPEAVVLSNDVGPTTQATAPPEVTEATAVPEPTSAPATTAPAPRGAVAVALAAARDDVWVQVNVDGQRVQAGLMRQGTVGTWTGNKVDLVIGRPSAVDLTVDGQSRPAEANMTFG